MFSERLLKGHRADVEIKVICKLIAKMLPDPMFSSDVQSIASEEMGTEINSNCFLMENMSSVHENLSKIQQNRGSITLQRLHKNFTLTDFVK